MHFDMVRGSKAIYSDKELLREIWIKENETAIYIAINDLG